MTHQVVPRLLLGAVHVVEGDTQGVRGHHTVGADGQAHPIQRPVQRAGVEAKLRAQCTRGCQTGADMQDGILRGDHCYICVRKTHWACLIPIFKGEVITLCFSGILKTRQSNSLNELL